MPKQYIVGDEFDSSLMLMEKRAFVLKAIHDEYGNDCMVRDVHEDTMMEATGALVPARRRRVYYLKVTA